MTQLLGNIEQYKAINCNMIEGCPSAISLTKLKHPKKEPHAILTKIWHKTFFRKLVTIFYDRKVYVNINLNKMNCFKY